MPKGTSLAEAMSNREKIKHVYFTLLSYAFFRDLPESSFVFYSSLLVVNSCSDSIALIWWLHMMASLHNGNHPIVAILIAEVLFKLLLIYTAV